MSVLKAITVHEQMDLLAKSTDGSIYVDISGYENLIAWSHTISNGHVDAMCASISVLLNAIKFYLLNQVIITPQYILTLIERSVIT